MTTSKSADGDRYTIATIPIDPGSGRADALVVAALAPTGSRPRVALEVHAGDHVVSTRSFGNPRTLELLSAALARGAAWLRSLGARSRADDTDDDAENPFRRTDADR